MSNLRPCARSGSIRQHPTFQESVGTCRCRASGLPGGSNSPCSSLQPYQFLAEIFSPIKLGDGWRAMFNAVRNLFAVTEFPVADPFGETFDRLHVAVLVIEDDKARHPRALDQNMTLDARTPHWGTLMILAPPRDGRGHPTFQCLECDGLDPLKPDKVRGWLKGELQPPK